MIRGDLPRNPLGPKLQIFMIDQLLTHLRKFLVNDVEVKVVEEKAVEVPQGKALSRESRFELNQMVEKDGPVSLFY